MNSRTSRPIRQPFKWSRPVTTRDSEASKADQHLISGHPFRSSGNDEDSPLDLLLDAFTKSPRLDFERPVFERFFAHRLLESIRDNEFEEPSGPVAWLFDVDQHNEPRAYSGLLSTKQLHHYTTLKRFKEKGMTDALRRRIYIPNPSSLNLGILVWRSTEEQNPSMRRMIFKHLTGDTAVSLASFSGAEFVLEFHMPCLVWKTNRVLLKDMRETMDGKPLRQGEPLSFLSASRDSNGFPEATDILYECQTSICVTGWDISAWTAVCLVDSYFDDESDEEDPRMLPHYPKSDEPDFPDSDPLCLANCLADKLMLEDPREYFLLACKFHVERISYEWENIVIKLQQKVDQYLHDPHIPLRRQRTNLGNADGDSANVEGSEEWFKQTSRLIEDLIIQLSRSVKCLKQFVERDRKRIDQCADEPTSAGLQSSFDDIIGIRWELEKFLDRLEDLKKKVGTFKSQLGLHVAIDGSRAIVLQHWNVSILQFVSPIALAGSTMQAGIVAGNVVLWFIALTFMFGVLTWKMRTVTQCVDFVIKKIWHKTPWATEEAVPTLEDSGASATTGSSVPPPTGSVRRRDRTGRTERDLEQVVGR